MEHGAGMDYPRFKVLLLTLPQVLLLDIFSICTAVRERSEICVVFLLNRIVDIVFDVQ